MTEPILYRTAGTAIANRNLDIRSAPTLDSTITGNATPGTQLSYDGYVLGGTAIAGLSKWYFTNDGKWFWAGGVNMPWWISDFGIDRVWAKTKGEGIVVITIDTGCHTCADIVAQRISGDNDGNGHGTLMASIIGGSGLHVAGVAPGVTFITVNISNNPTAFSPADFLNALSRVGNIIQPGKRYVVNCSLAFLNRLNDEEQNAIYTEIEQLRLRWNVVFVCAAGNQAVNEPRVPGGFNNAISVGPFRKTGSEYEMFIRSNYYNGISLLAPGVFPSQHLKEIFPIAPSGEGSSHATAYISGLIALGFSATAKAGIDFNAKLFIEAICSPFNFPGHTFNIVSPTKLQTFFNHF